MKPMNTRQTRIWDESSPTDANVMGIFDLEQDLVPGRWGQPQSPGKCRE